MIVETQLDKMMAVLRPMVNTSISCEEIQPKYTWVGVVLLRGVTSRPWQGHLKVTAGQINTKEGEIA